jgi:RP/EB family microtubule-associated protein
MMDGAYFTSRKEILDFFNNLLDMNLTKIEQTATGAVACQLFDYIFPGAVPMKRVNWHARSDFQFIENYKILQMAMNKTNVRKHVDVDNLIRAKYQDNLEFCQWLKAFFEQAAPAVREDYNPLQRRLIGRGGSKNLDAIFLPNKRKALSGSSVSASAPRRRPSLSASPSRRTSNASVSSGNSNTAPLRSSITNGPNIPKTLTTKSRTPMSSAPSNKRTVELEAERDELIRKNDTLKRKNAETDLILEHIEKERDFYFDKLRGIEVMLQVHEEKEDGKDPEALIQRIYKVLYAKIEDNIVVTDDGELLENMVEDGAGDDLLNDTITSIMNNDDNPVEEHNENVSLDENKTYKAESMEKQMDISNPAEEDDIECF